MQTKKNRWTSQEDEILRTNYPTLGTKIPQLNYRTSKGIWNRACRLGLTDKQKTISFPWTAEEINILKVYYPLLGTNIPQLKHRTREAIRTKVKDLKLTTSKCRNWTEEEDEILKTFYPLLGTNIPQLKHRTKEAIRSRIKALKNKKILPNGKYNNISGIQVIVLSRHNHNYEYMFEDGERVKTTNFNPTGVTHPKLHPSKCRSVKTYCGFKTKYICTNTDSEIWTAYYEVECQKCGCKAIMTPQQMQKHFRTCQQTHP